MSAASNPYINLLKTAWRFARHERRRYVLVYFLLTCSTIVNAVNPILFGWFVGKVQSDSDHVLHNAFLFAAAYVGLELLVWCFHGPARIMERSLSFNLSRNFLQERYHQVLHLPVKWHQDHHSGASINRIRKAYEALREFFDRGFMYVNVLAKCLFSIIAMLWFSPFYGSIAIVMGIATIVIIRLFDKPFMKTLDEVNEKEHVVSATLFDSLSNIMTVITLRLEKSMENGLLEKVAAIFKPFRRNALLNEYKWFCAGVMIVIIYAMITLGYIHQNWVPGRVFYVGSLVTLLGYVNQFTSVFQDIAWQYTDIMQFSSYVQTAASIETAYKDQHRADGNDGLPENWNTIRIGDLDFSHNATYDEGYAPQSLHDIHLEIHRGKKIALIGESGSGKSTLLALLRGLYLPQEGVKFLVDNIPFTLDSLSEAVTLFPQESEIFENTLEYNITLGLPFPTEEIQKVCDQAHFSDVVTHLPQGLASDIRERGVNLSGGQKQRLALARGLLAARDSHLVLLDEPTSSVDPKTEALIYQNLFTAFPDKAVISSMHRLHLLPGFDHIYVLQKGRIVAEGNFEQLKAESQVFQELWQHQQQEDRSPMTDDR